MSIISLISLSTKSLGSISPDERGQLSSDTPIMVWATWEEIETREENLSPNPIMLDFLVGWVFLLVDWVLSSRASMSSDLSQLTWLPVLDFRPELYTEAPCYSTCCCFINFKHGWIFQKSSFHLNSTIVLAFFNVLMFTRVLVDICINVSKSSNHISPERCQFATILRNSPMLIVHINIISNFVFIASASKFPPMLILLCVDWNLHKDNE